MVSSKVSDMGLAQDMSGVLKAVLMKVRSRYSRRVEMRKIVLVVGSRRVHVLAGRGGSGRML